VRQAFKDAGIKRFVPSKHAIERATVRFGIKQDEVNRWINDLMAKAKYVTTGNNGCEVYESDDVRLVVDTAEGVVVTVHNTLRLDFLRPTLDREVRKIKREYTRRQRGAERRLADSIEHLAKKIRNYANARNPNTRRLILERINEARNTIEEAERHIERIKDDRQAKIRAIELIAE